MSCEPLMLQLVILRGFRIGELLPGVFADNLPCAAECCLSCMDTTCHQ